MTADDTGLWQSRFSIPRNINFVEKDRLWWLVALGVLLIAYLVMQFVRRRAAVRFTNVKLLDKVAPRRPGWRRHIPALFLLAGLGGMILAPSRESASPHPPKVE